MRQETIERLNQSAQIVCDAAARQKAAALDLIESMKASNGLMKTAMTSPPPAPRKP